MENEVCEQFCAMLEEVIENSGTICVCLKSVNFSTIFTIVPIECYCWDDIYITSENDSIVYMKNIDSITYDEIEDEYRIRAGQDMALISRI